MRDETKQSGQAECSRKKCCVAVVRDTPSRNRPHNDRAKLVRRDSLSASYANDTHTREAGGGGYASHVAVDTNQPMSH